MENQNIFGTDGIRSKIGQKYLTLQNIPLLGIAIAEWAIKKYSYNPKALIISDTRESGDFVKTTLISGFLLKNIEIIDAFVLPTPAAIWIAQEFCADLSIIISASHNSYEDNGIKIIDSNSGKLLPEDELKISKKFYSLQNKINTDYNSFSKITYAQEAQNIYINKIITYFEKDFLKHKKIILDTANGATYKIAPEIFRLLGAQVITINNNPNGKNINLNCGSTNISQLQKTIINTDADIGIAFDGDGDRVVFVNKFGELKNGDDILAILINNYTYSSYKQVVGTIMANQGLENYLKEKNIELIRTAVGDKYISECLSEKNLILGAEQSGHVILKDINIIGDGILTALKTLETLQKTDNWSMKSFKKHFQISKNLPVRKRQALESSPLSDIIQNCRDLLKNGRIVARYSGTENCLRLMVESSDNELANEVIQILQENVLKELE